MKKPMLWMAACCLVPLALTVIISLLSFRSSLSWLPSLICPVLMIGSMWAMRAPEGDCHQKKEANR